MSKAPLLPPGTVSIVGWETNFENNRSRVVTNLQWVPVPNKHDGERYTLVMLHDHAAEIFAAWNLIIQVASKCQRRGTLLKSNGTPHTPGSLSIMTRAPKEWFEKAFEYLSSDEIKWLKIQGDSVVTGDRQDDDTCLSQRDVNEGKKEEKERREENVQNEQVQEDAHNRSNGSAKLPALNLLDEVPEDVRQSQSAATLVERWQEWIETRKSQNIDTQKGELQKLIEGIRKKGAVDPIATALKVVKFAVKNETKGITQNMIDTEIDFEKKKGEEPKELMDYSQVPLAE